MAAFILILGCSFIVGLVAAMASGHFFMSTLLALLFGGQVAALNYAKLCSQGLEFAVLLIVPFIFMGAVAGAGLGTVFSNPASGLGGADE